MTGEAEQHRQTRFASRDLILPDAAIHDPCERVLGVPLKRGGKGVVIHRLRTTGLEAVGECGLDVSGAGDEGPGEDWLRGEVSGGPTKPQETAIS